MSQPNLLFIFTDQQRYNTLAAYGNTRIQMPNLNRLAEQSTVFEQAYVTQPVCTPSRATILSGLYPHSCGCTQNNVPLRPETPCLPEMLAEGRYVTGYFGKWHLGDEIFAQHGFEHWRSIDDTYRACYSDCRDPDTRSTYHHWLADNGFAPSDGDAFDRGEVARLPEPFSKPAYLAHEASQFLRENKTNPFVLYVNFFEPHMPYFGPRDGQYESSGIPLPENFAGVPTVDQPLKTRLFQQAYHRHGHGSALKTEDDWRRMIARYWGLCSLVDTHLGAILNTLEECGQAENTIVVYTSDHGDMMGSHRLIAKCVMFEEAVRVPMLMRLPGQRSGRRVRGPVSQIDLVPTLLDLMGRPIPSHLEGKSIRPLLAGGSDAATGPAFIEWNGPDSGITLDRLNEIVIDDTLAGVAPREQIARAIRDPVRSIVTPDGWKFNYSPLGEHELYDLNEDPGETRNLAAGQANRKKMCELGDEIRRWQERTADTVSLPAIE